MLRRIACLKFVVALLTLAVFGPVAMAVSGGALAIGRAFSYAYNNPAPEVGSGPMGSSMYSGNSFNVPTAGGGGAPMATPGPLTSSMRSTQVYTPMAPLAVSSAGGAVTLGAAPGYSYTGEPIQDLTSVLAEKSGQGPSINAVPLTSLAPQTPAPVRSAMLRGERLFRQGNYQQAAQSFETARDLSKDSAESLLSLAQTCFAMGEKTFDQGAQCLAKALVAFPDLPLVRVRPKDFFGNADDYKRSFASLEKFAKDNPKNAGALLLLGYMQWREGMVDKALDTLDSAMAVASNSDLAPGINVMLDGINRSGQVLLSQAPPMGPVQDYPWAGIRLGMPAGFKPSPRTSLSQVVVGVVESADKSNAHQIILYGYPIADASVTLKGFTDYMTDFMQKSPTVSNMKTDTEAEIPFVTGKALVRLLSYDTSGGKKASMGWVSFIREPKDRKGGRVGFMLGLVASEKQSEKLLPTLAAVAKTIALADPVSQPPAPIELGGGVIEDSQLLFSVAHPNGWVAKQTDKGYEFGQMDLSRGNVVSPRAKVIVQAIGAEYTAQSFGEDAINRNTPKGFVRKVLSKGPAKVAGRGGYQFVISQGPEEGMTGPSSVLVGRLTVVPGQDGKQTLRALVVECRDGQAKDVEALADKWMSTYQILSPPAASAGDN